MVCFFFFFFFLLQTIIPTAFRSQVGKPYIGIVSGVPVTRQKTGRDLLLLAQSCNTCLSNLPNLLGGQTAQTAVVSHPFHEEFLVPGGLVVRNLLWIISSSYTKRSIGSTPRSEDAVCYVDTLTSGSKIAVCLKETTN